MGWAKRAAKGTAGVAVAPSAAKERKIDRYGAPTAPSSKHTHDAWGRLLMKPGDGHSAWGCNNYNCSDHPAALYGGAPLQPQQFRA